MKSSKTLVPAVVAAALVGAIGLAYVQTQTPSQSTDSSTPMTNQFSTGTMMQTERPAQSDRNQQTVCPLADRISHSVLPCATAKWRSFFLQLNPAHAIEVKMSPSKPVADTALPEWAAGLKQGVLTGGAILALTLPPAQLPLTGPPTGIASVSVQQTSRNADFAGESASEDALFVANSISISIRYVVASSCRARALSATSRLMSYRSENGITSCLN